MANKEKSLFEILHIRNKLERKSMYYRAINNSVLKKGEIIRFKLNGINKNKNYICVMNRDITLKPLQDSRFDEYNVWETDIYYNLKKINAISGVDFDPRINIDRTVELMDF